MVTYVLLCLESGLNCDFVIRGDTKEEFLKNVANHATQEHSMRDEDNYLSNIPKFSHVPKIPFSFLVTERL